MSVAMNRRRLLKEAPAAALVAAVPAVAHGDPAESEIMALFRRWQASRRWTQQVDVWATPNVDEFLEPHFVEQDEIEYALATSRPTTAAEMAAIVLAITIYGDTGFGLKNTTAGRASLPMLAELAGVDLAEIGEMV